MKSKVFQRVLAFGVCSVLYVAGTSASFADDLCAKISGAYDEKDAGALILGPDGQTLYGELMNGGRPNFYGTCVNGKVKVDFTDDPGCCTGRFDGSVIKWSNGTTWTKTPMPN